MGRNARRRSEWRDRQPQPVFLDMKGERLRATPKVSHVDDLVIVNAQGMNGRATNRLFEQARPYEEPFSYTFSGAPKGWRRLPVLHEPSGFRILTEQLGQCLIAGSLPNEYLTPTMLESLIVNVTVLEHSWNEARMSLPVTHPGGVLCDHDECDVTRMQSYSLPLAFISETGLLGQAQRLFGDGTGLQPD